MCERIPVIPQFAIACAQCGECFFASKKEMRNGRKFCSNACKYASRRPPERSCQECGKSFYRKPKGVNGKNDKALFCSKACYFSARNAGRVAWDKTGQLKGQWHKNGMWANAPSTAFKRNLTALWSRINKFCVLLPQIAAKIDAAPQCETCGGFCLDGAKRFCSYACNKKWRGPRQCKCGDTVENSSAFGPPPQCKECRRSALAKQRRKLKKLIGDYRKRCRKHGGFYNPKCRRKDILIRDGFKCHVCGCKCHKSANFNDPKAATVDHHPVPLSKGGDHDWHNVRCACRQCNSRKGDAWDGQRMLALRGGG